MVSLFRDKSSFGVFGLIAISILLHAHFLLEPPGIKIDENEGLLYFLMRPLYALPSVSISLIYFIIILLQALRLNYILNDLRLFQKPSFTIALAYILLTAVFPAWNHITGALIANALIIWIIGRVGRLHNSQKARSVIYNIGLLTGITILLYHPSAPLALLAFFGLAIVRPLRLNELFVLLLGVLTPFYFLLSLFYFKNNLPAVLVYLPQFDWHMLSPSVKKPFIVASIAAGVLIIAGILIWQNYVGRLVIQARKIWGILLLFLLFFIPVPFIVQNAGFDSLLLAMVPAAAFAANAFYYPKSSLLPALLFWGMVAAIVYNNWVAIKY